MSSPSTPPDEWSRCLIAPRITRGSAARFCWLKRLSRHHPVSFCSGPCGFFGSIPDETTFSNPSHGCLSSRLYCRLGTVWHNHGLNYPHAEAVLIHCHLKGIPPIGWGRIDGGTSHLHLWEFNSTDLDGRPIETSQRHPASRQLTMPTDAKTIANYSDPAFVLNGWIPRIEP